MWKGSNMDARYSYLPNYIFNPFTLVTILATVIATYKWIILFYLIQQGIFKIDKFTYWNFTWNALFYSILAMFFIIHRREYPIYASPFLRWLILLVCPLLVGSAFLVCVMIVILIQLNQNLFMDETDPANTPIGLYHTGDWILHNLPMIEIGFLLLSGLDTIWRKCLYQTESICLQQNMRGSSQQLTSDHHYVDLIRVRTTTTRPWYQCLEEHYLVIYFLWSFLSPFLPMSIYGCFFDPYVIYPTNVLSRFQTILIVLVCGFVIGTSQWVFIQCRHSIQRGNAEEEEDRVGFHNNYDLLSSPPLNRIGYVNPR